MSSTKSRAPPGRVTDDLRRIGVVLVGHGSSSRVEPFLQIDEQANALRDTGRFADVAAATLFGDPARARGAIDVGGDELHVVPMFLCHGQLAGAAVTKIARSEARGRARPIVLHRPLGLMSGLAEIAKRRALDCARQNRNDPAGTSLIVAAHGSCRNPASRHAAERIAAEVQMAGPFAPVTTAYLREPPFLHDLLRSTVRPVVVCGLFIADGRHSCQDVPEILAECRFPTDRYCGSIGTDPVIPALIVRELESNAAIATA